MTAVDSVYGYCPYCGDPGVLMEKSPNGKTYCRRGHGYPHNARLNDPGDRLTADFDPKVAFFAHMQKSHPDQDLQELSAGGFSNPHTHSLWLMYRNGLKDALQYAKQLADKLEDV